MHRGKRQADAIDYRLWSSELEVGGLQCVIGSRAPHPNGWCENVLLRLGSGSRQTYDEGKMTINVGDIVRLKSGGPRLTVTDINEQRADCVYFRDGAVVTFQFPIQALETILPPAPSPLWMRAIGLAPLPQRR